MSGGTQLFLCVLALVVIPSAGAGTAASCLWRLSPTVTSSTLYAVPRFRGRLSAGSALSGLAGRMRHHAGGIDLREYPPEFRREAVELYRRGGRPLAKVARDLGVAN